MDCGVAFTVFFLFAYSGGNFDSAAHTTQAIPNANPTPLTKVNVRFFNAMTLPLKSKRAPHVVRRSVRFVL
jgi:hypothetical protein